MPDEGSFFVPVIQDYVNMVFRVAEPDPENLIRILSVLWQCKVVKTRSKYFKIRAFTHFQANFPFFQIKIITYHPNIRRNMFDGEKKN